MTKKASESDMPIGEVLAGKIKSSKIALAQILPQ